MSVPACVETLRPVMDAGARNPITPTARLSLRGKRALAALLLASLGALAPALPQTSGDGALPERLSGTGLYVAGSTTQVQPDVLSFTPQYPLWSDGADKRRWIRLPAGTVIDAAKADAWQFPPGTQLWKQFAYGDRRVETRYIERLRNGSWRYATYLWNEHGTAAVLAPARSVTLDVPAAPHGRYDVPGRADCTACHEGAATPVLGFSALQLSPERDALAVHAQAPQRGDVDLRELAARGVVRNLPAALLERAPRVHASSPIERAALGYLHANCGHCHNRSGDGAPVRLTLAQSALDGAASRSALLASAVGVAGRYRAAALPADAPLIEPTAPERSVLVARMHSRQPQLQMPPLGTRIADREGLALIERWIHQDLSPVEEFKP
jgi:hypothetical protein